MIERHTDEHGNQVSSLSNCPLCGVPIGQRTSSGRHVYYNCPAAPAFSDLGSLRDGGPSEEEVRETIRREISTDSAVAADGGQITCDECADTVAPEHHRVYLQPAGGHKDLCLECQTDVNSERLYRPADAQEGSQ
ncbi:hypothetical protein IL252_11350 [Halomicrobium sp. IBSBa]|uniref:hypothetical protein n=1 Tax=Halomicrobium sp. IBSBa TaxID=2778916 RepID=UPI001ABF369F|nr:hypothetical protein [Halomicrobium sp. IBSBa]MBO4248410.1 hypothetical protein [Halomicrobium sp. IBSBa]